VEPPAVSPPPIVDWPAEDVRRIVALRLVSSGERFQGRSLRQALAAEGFVFGRFSIFHKPDAQGRAVVSAASLSKPGTFTPDSMDTQRFAGLNLFAILPGPLSPPQAFDELLATARSLNDRLQGALQDERGKPLTPAQIATLRESLSAAPPPLSPPEAETPT
jgi:cell division protein ZipA